MGVLVPPTIEPLTLGEAKAHLRYPLADQDALITDAIRAARDYVERETQRALLLQTRECRAWPSRRRTFGTEWTDSHVDDFTHNRIAWRAGWPYWPQGPVAIDLPYAAPLQAVLSVTVDGAIADPTTYDVDPASEPARVFMDWTASPVVVTYTCGAVDAAALSPGLKQLVAQVVGKFFRWRGDELEPVPGALEALPMSITQQLDAYRLKALA